MTAPFGVAALCKLPSDKRDLCGILGITALFTFTGIGHFIKTESMMQMLPTFVSWRFALIYLSGVVELLAAWAVLLPKRRGIVGGFLLIMLVAFLPVNVYSAVNKVPMGGHAWGIGYLLIRIPLQLAIIAWVYWFAIRATAANQQAGRTR